MNDIVTSLLTGQRKMVLHGIEIDLKPLKHDTQKNKELEARKRAKSILKLIRS